MTLHRGLYGNPARGFLAGKMTFRNIEDTSEIDGEWRWEKQNGATPRSALYPTGFSLTRRVVGCRYQPPSRNTRAWSSLVDSPHNIWLRMHGPAITDDTATIGLDRVMTWTTTNQVLHYGPDLLAVKFIPATGSITGTFRESGTTKTQTFGGVLLQTQNILTGAYTTPNRSGRLVLQPR